MQWPLRLGSKKTAGATAVAVIHQQAATNAAAVPDAVAVQKAAAADSPVVTASTQHSAQPQRQRAVSAVVDEEHAIEGPGLEITRPFPTRRMRNFDPFLLFDQAGPKVYPPGGFRRESHLGQHPHRGFEAISYIVEGGFEHYDSTGKHGSLRPGDVQVMTAGGGVVHGGAPIGSFERDGGRLHGYQIWLNLPAADRMAPAVTRDYPAADLPVVVSEDGLVTARVLAGSAMGVTAAAVRTHVPITMVHFTVRPRGAVDTPLPAGYNAMVHVSSGRGVFGPAKVPAREEQSVFFERCQEPSSVRISCPAGEEGPLDVLLLAGQPTDEPVVQHGPFVGSTMDEVQRAWVDYRAGLMGRLFPDGSAKKSAWATAGEA